MNLIIRCLILITILINVSCSYRTYHSPLNDGIRSFQAEDYRQAFICLRPEAKKGQPDAQYAIGYMYYYGKGVVEDRKRAWYWINKAATQGQPDAIAALAILKNDPCTLYP